MEFTTKFNPGDRVWVMKGNKPHQFKVHRVEIEILESRKVREKYVDFVPGATSLDRDREYLYWDFECFPTKKELLNSFLEDGE